MAIIMDGVGLRNRLLDELRGDGDFDSVNAVAGYMTKTPGGTGSMTIAGLMMNTVELAEK